MDTWMCSYAKEEEEDFNKYIEITVQESLIGKEIICYFLKKKGVIIP